IRQIRSLLYEEGFTIGGARQKLSNGGVQENASTDSSATKEAIQQLRAELEEVLAILKV
ncbi:MAG: MerR family transcriptional regulator, partial [Candidatus Heimdallarchaeota archaeon]|nr:MerR family transcriptional regulator [Candidatus Heimdallarchaeota archaeon]